MAKATINRVPVKQYTTDVTLTLTPEEAATLLIVAHKIGGHPDDTLRGYVDNIQEAILDRMPANFRMYDMVDASSFVAGGNGMSFKSSTKHNESFKKLVDRITNG